MATAWLGQNDTSGTHFRSSSLLYSGMIGQGVAWLGQDDTSGSYFGSSSLVYIMIYEGLILTGFNTIPSVVDFVTAASGYAYAAREAAPSTSSVPDGNYIPGTLPGSVQIISF